MSLVGELFASLGIKVDAGSFARADVALDKAKAKVDGMYQDPGGRWRTGNGRFLSSGERAAAGVANAHEAAGRRVRKAHEDSTNSAIAGLGRLGAAVAAYFSLRAGYSALIKSNAEREEVRGNIAGMLSLARKSDFRTEVGVADTLIENLAKRAASLPGTTSEYVQMLGMLAQPLVDAKLSLKDLEDLTVNATVAAKGLRIGWDVAARDIDQAVRGQFHSVDQFSGKVLGSIGYKGEEGRSKFNALSQEKRAAELKRALLQPQFTDMAAAAGNTFKGMLATLQDAAENFGRSVGKPLFGGLSDAIRSANSWIEKHRDMIEEVAAVVGTVLREAFDIAGRAITKIVDALAPHKDLLIKIFGAVLQDALLVTKGLLDAVSMAFDFIMEHATAFKVIAAAIALPFAPFIALIALVHKLINAFDLLAVVRSVAGAIADAFSSAADVIRGAWESVLKFFGTIWDGITSGFWAVVDGIKAAFRAAYDYVKDIDWLDAIPIIGAGKRIAGGVSSLAGDARDALLGRTGTMADVLGGVGRGAGETNIKVGDVHVSSPNADPKQVAIEVRRELGNVLRETRDQL